MSPADLTQEIGEHLRRLPRADQRRVLEFVRALELSRPKGMPGRDLVRFAGTLDDEGAREVSAAIEEACERVERNWN